MYCIHCGNEHSDAAKFCQNCGKAIVQERIKGPESEAIQAEQESPPSPQQSKIHRDDPSQKPIPDQPKLEDFVATVPANHDVYVHPIKGFKSVKNGFSWPAFFFGFWWSLFKTLWLNAAIYWVATFGFGFVLGFLLALAGIAPPSWIFYLWGIFVAIVWGANGNNWVRTKLINCGYERVREGLGSGGIDTQHIQDNPDTTNGHDHKFNCPFCRQSMANYGRCSKCGNTVDKWVLETNS